MSIDTKGSTGEAEAATEPDLGSARFEPIQHVNLTERVYRIIKDRILSQEIEVGERLRDEKLASQLGVSRTPVREALMHLSREGLVEVIPRSGTRVRTFTDEDIEEIFEIRTALEILAMRKAVRQIDQKEVAGLRRSWKTAEAALKAGEVGPALEMDQKMHRLILEACGNQRLQEIMKQINDYVALFRNLGARTPDHSGYTYRIPEILKALSQRDARAAVRALSEHISSAKRQTLQDFQKRQPHAVATTGDDETE